ncbi:unnamed protein product [Cylicostephanus goldi]|uniref:Uncharacterized protein n=1 Tax=Cylicostephanus goldi TaxID=71465 RepID=A0A3P7MTB2_CYLGO|nr:unnamed protein product [Cylicostephanus goldi]
MSKTSSFTRKLVEKGCINHSTDTLSPEVRRKVEENLSRAPSMQSLRGSIGNLAGWRGSAMNLTDTPNLSRFRSLNPNFRSFNMKKTTEKQQEVIDRLSQLRENLRSSENFVDRGIIPKRNNNLASPAVIKT